MTEYNDFGFTAMDADELASVDTKIVAKTTSAVEVRTLQKIQIRNTSTGLIEFPSFKRN